MPPPISTLLQARDQARTVATLAFNQLLFPEGHPYRHSTGGDSISTARLDSAMVRDFWSGTNSGAPSGFIVCNGAVYFTAYELSTGRELWKTDGTPAGTVRSSAPFAL